jgi:MFS family permease
VVLLLAGAAALVAGTDRTVRAAVPAVFLVGLAGAGIAAMLTQAMTAGRIPDATSVLIGAATALGGAIGLATGGWLVAHGRTGRVPAVIGSAGLTVACALGVLTVTGQRPDPGAALPLTLIGIAGLGLGLAASALRLALTDVEPHRRGLAAGAGVVAAVSGSALGGMIGAGEGLNMLRGDVDGVAIGLIGFVVAAAVAVALAATLPARPLRPTSAAP